LLKKWKVPCFLKEQRLLKLYIEIIEFVVEMIYDFHLKGDEKLLLVKECITQEGINTTNFNILSPIYYTV